MASHKIVQLSGATGSQATFYTYSWLLCLRPYGTSFLEPPIYQMHAYTVILRVSKKLVLRGNPAMHLWGPIKYGAPRFKYYIFTSKSASLTTTVMKN